MSHTLLGISIRTALLAAFAMAIVQSPAQPYGQPDRGQPGDEMIQRYLLLETEKIERDFPASFKTVDDWIRARPELLREYYDMLGLWPIPEKTPLNATVTSKLDRGDYVVEMLHYQSKPGLYVTANLYRPARVAPGERLPAILYVCGHSGRGRNGNKVAFQSHGIWFARHGYVCLIVDTLQLGEIAGIHHGTYREGRWWWLARGYTSAGVECWNGVRGIDYLLSRPEVAPDRIGVTGISGGGAATFWVAAADERVKVAIPVSGMADLVSYVPNRVINGHCDCMFLHNTYRWPWTQIAALIAPRPMFFMNSDQDPIFPMDANDRVINRLERIYSWFGAGDQIDAFVSIGGHAYRKDLRQASFRFMNTHLKNDPRPVQDSEIDLVTGPREEVHPIAPEQLRAFPQDSDIPKDALNREIDRHFVPKATVSVPEKASFDSWKREITTQLRKRTFGYFPERIPPAEKIHAGAGGLIRLRTEPAIEIELRKPQTESPRRIVLWVSSADLDDPVPDWLKTSTQNGDAIYVCTPRGVGRTKWTSKNPPNYVERSHVLLGRTVDTGRVWDIAAAVRFLRAESKNSVPVYVAGSGAAGVLAAYAALIEPDVAGLMIHQPPASHMSDAAPSLLNVLRICDIPDVLGMVSPRPLTLSGADSQVRSKVAAIYKASGSESRLQQ